MCSVFDNSKNDRVSHEAAWDALILFQKHCHFNYETESSIKKSNVYNCWWRSLSFFNIVDM